jgi:hypothetical protein
MTARAPQAYIVPHPRNVITEADMNRIVALLASVAVLAVAVDAASQEAAPPAASAEMQNRMTEMQALMDRVRNTQDPAERQRLMAEHMRLMHEGMMMMGPMMGGPAGNQGSQQPCAENDAQCRMQRMQREQGMMGQRMGMMQMMMQQMMEHMTQQDAGGHPGAVAPNEGPAGGQSHEQHH